MPISNAQLQNTETTLREAAQQEVILSITFCNTGADTRRLSLYAYPAGGSASDATCIIKDLPLCSTDTFIWTTGEKFLLSTGDKISAIADASNEITATTTYMGF